VSATLAEHSAVAACQCRLGTHASAVFVDGVCEECPRGATCDGSENLRALAGYWILDEQVLECPFGECFF